jgi:hypothetical protein
MLVDHRRNTGGKFVHQYKNDGKGRRVGVVCAFIQNDALTDNLYVGASRANRKLHDKFDPHIGLWQAVKEATRIDASYPESFDELHDGPTVYRTRFDHMFPLSLHKLVCRMIFRARRQFYPKIELSDDEVEARNHQAREACIGANLPANFMDRLK